MTREQEYLAWNMTEEDIEYCMREAAKLEHEYPWDGNTDAGSWLTVVMRTVANEIAYHRGLYCAEMEE